MKPLFLDLLALTSLRTIAWSRSHFELCQIGPKIGPNQNQLGTRFGATRSRSLLVMHYMPRNYFG